MGEICCKVSVSSDLLSKGNPVNTPEPGRGCSGNTSEAGDGCGGPDESFLFLLTSEPTQESDCPEIGLGAWERWSVLDCFGAPSSPLENLAE